LSVLAMCEMMYDSLVTLLLTMRFVARPAFSRCKPSVKRIWSRKPEIPISARRNLVIFVNT
jgi:hypothetical protein